MEGLLPRSKLPSNNSYWLQESDIFYYNKRLELIANKISGDTYYLWSTDKIYKKNRKYTSRYFKQETRV
jgi:hypothetical protein